MLLYKRNKTCWEVLSKENNQLTMLLNMFTSCHFFILSVAGSN